MGFDEGRFILDNPTGTYYSGQLIKGRVVFELTKVKKVRGELFFTSYLPTLANLCLPSPHIVS